jgi:hypothetical protein
MSDFQINDMVVERGLIPELRRQMVICSIRGDEVECFEAKCEGIGSVVWLVDRTPVVYHESRLEYFRFYKL